MKQPAALVAEASALLAAVEHLCAARPQLEGGRKLARAVEREQRVAAAIAASQAREGGAAPSEKARLLQEARLQGLANNLGGLKAELAVALQARRPVRPAAPCSRTGAERAPPRRHASAAA